MAFQPVAFQQHWPGTPTLNSVTNPTTVGFDISIACGFPRQAGTVHDIYYRPNATGSWLYYGATSGAGTAIVVTVTGLSAGTLYEFRIGSRRGNLYSEYSKQLTNTTLTAVVDTKFGDYEDQADGNAPWVVYFYNAANVYTGFEGVLIAADVVLTSAFACATLTVGSDYASAGFADSASTPNRQDKPISGTTGYPSYLYPDEDIGLIYIGSSGFSLGTYVAVAPYCGSTEPTFAAGTLLASLGKLYFDGTPSVDPVLYSSVMQLISKADANTIGAPGAITVSDNMWAALNTGFGGNWGAYGAGLMAYDSSLDYAAGILCTPADATNDGMSVYTRVSKYSSWIFSETGISPYT